MSAPAGRSECLVLSPLSLGEGEMHMPFDRAATIDAFLSAAAAKQPAPGGGSVTALVGALAAAMVEMVVNYSIGKKDLAEHQPTFHHALAELSRARALLLELMVEDQAAFEALTVAR